MTILWTEKELLQELGLPACPNRSGYSNRISIWIEKGLPFKTRSQTRQFLKDEIEDFLKKTYGISLQDFRQHVKDRENLAYVGAEYL